MCVKLRTGAVQVRHMSHSVSLMSQGISLSRYDLDASETLFVAGERSFVAKWCLICLTEVLCRYDLGVGCETGESPERIAGGRMGVMHLGSDIRLSLGWMALSIRL